MREHVGVGVGSSSLEKCRINPKDVYQLSFNRDFKQIATATSTAAVVDAVSWGEYVS